MKNMKKILSLALACVMLLGVSITASAAPVTDTTTTVGSGDKVTVAANDTYTITDADVTTMVPDIRVDGNELTPLTVEEAGSDADKSNQDKPTPVVLQAEGLYFSVTVPTVLPVYVDDMNVPATADNVKIINNGYGPVKVRSVKVEEQNAWKLKAYDVSAMDKEDVGAKTYCMQIDGENVNAADGTVTLGANLSKRIQPTSVTDESNITTFPYAIKTAPQAKAIAPNVDDAHIGNVIFTLGWDFGTVSP